MVNSANGRIDSASKVIEAAPEIVYQAFTNPDSLIKWLPPDGMSGHVNKFELYEGGTYQITLTYEEGSFDAAKTSENKDVSNGTFLSLTPNKKVVQAVKFKTDNPEYMSEMIQTWYLEAVPEGTKVTIMCENVPEGIRKEDHLLGLNSTLENLDKFIE